jgi:methionyl-tRNA formyltransferase
LGFRQTIEIASSYPLQIYFSKHQSRNTDALLRCLPRPQVTINLDSVKWVNTVNGPDAAETVRDLGPEVLIQAGAGILRAQMLKIPHIASINLHHGIAPLIRGMNSIQWGLWENRPDWLGSTVHEMNEGIDTGSVLAYAPVRQQDPGEGFSSLFTRATELGVDRLLEVLSRLSVGERWTLSPVPGEGVYRSTMSGWKLAALAARLNAQRRQSVGDSRPRAARY